MPPELDRLLADLLGSVADHNAAIAADRISVDQWQQLVAKDLLAGHYAAYMLGQGSKDVTPQIRTIVTGIVGDQVEYLNRFADLIVTDGWREAFGARAALYIGAMQQSFWRGRSGGIEMPYYPGDGSTPCLSNCRCHLDYDWIDRDNLDVDVYWKLGAEDHCSECPQRAANSPYRFREGVRI